MAKANPDLLCRFCSELSSQSSCPGDPRERQRAWCAGHASLHLVHTPHWSGEKVYSCVMKGPLGVDLTSREDSQCLRKKNQFPCGSPLPYKRLYHTHVPVCHPLVAKQVCLLAQLLAEIGVGWQLAPDRTISRPTG